MAYKRYFHRNGKTFGPYYYESYRDKSGKVKKRYVGVTNPNEDKSPKLTRSPSKNRSLLFFIVPAVIILLIVAGFFVFHKSITGNVALDIQEGKEKGILTRLLEFLAGRITGRVAENPDNHVPEESITETSDSKIVDVSNLINETQDIAIEYYTDAPVANETNITGGKEIVVSAPSELNYTDNLC